MKLVIAGGGLIVKTVAPSLPSWGWEVEGICVTPRGAEAAQALAEQWGCPAVYTDYSKMLEEIQAKVVYVAVPNHLHFAMTKEALEKGFHVILEKPITSNYREAQVLAEIAKGKGLFLWEAITTLYQPNYAILKEQLGRIGDVKIVNCNFSQYSSRYDAFCAGALPPVFDQKKSGGALMDLNLYNLHWLVGLFGAPEGVKYHANLQRGIDTSGILTLQYPDFQAVSIAAKDCGAPCRYLIQGTKGYILQTAPANVCGTVTVHLNDGTEERFDVPTGHRLEAEFAAFRKQLEENDLESCYEMLSHSMRVIRTVTQARLSAGITFPADKVEMGM